MQIDRTSFDIQLQAKARHATVLPSATHSSFSLCSLHARTAATNSGSSNGFLSTAWIHGDSTFYRSRSLAAEMMTTLGFPASSCVFR